MLKWEMPKKDFLQQLEIVQKGLPIRTPLPVLENIYFNIDDGMMSLKSTNLEMGVATTIPVPLEETNYEALLPSKLVDLVRHAKGDIITIQINEEEEKIKVISDKSVADLFLMDAEDFPAFPEKKGKKIEISQATLKDILKKSTFCVSKEEGKQVFQGVFFELEKNQLKATASDTFRLTHIKEAISFSDDKISFLCPGKNMMELNKVIRDKEETVSIYIQDRKIIFDLGDHFLFSLLMDNKYPDLSNAVPGEPKTTLTLNREVLEQSLSKALLLAESVNNLVNISLEDKLVIKSQSEVGKVEVDLEINNFKGEVFNDIYFNGRFLLEPIKILEEEEVQLDFFGPLGPCTIRIPDRDSFLYLALPVKTERE